MIEQMQKSTIFCVQMVDFCGPVTYTLSVTNYFPTKSPDDIVCSLIDILTTTLS